MRFFFFGTLQDPDVLEIVLGRPVDGEVPMKPARLHGYDLATARDDWLPVLRPKLGSVVDGVVVDGLSGHDLERIAFFEDVEYDAEVLHVVLQDGVRVEATVYVGSHLEVDVDAPWRYQHWVAVDKPILLELARRWMDYLGEVDLTAAEEEWDRTRAEIEAVYLADVSLTRR